jgi:hypothetical protein
LSSYHRFAGVLILLGGILGLMIAAISLTMVPFMSGILGDGYGVMWQYGGIMMGRYGLFGYPQFGLAIMPSVMAIWSFLGLVGALLSITCGLKLRRGCTRNVIFIGAIGGVLLLLSFSWLPGLMVLAGSVPVYFE